MNGAIGRGAFSPGLSDGKKTVDDIESSGEHIGASHYCTTSPTLVSLVVIMLIQCWRWIKLRLNID